MSDFLELVISLVSELRLHFPVTPYHQKHRCPTQFHHLHELLPLSEIRFSSSYALMRQTLEGPLLLTSDVEQHLTPVFEHYLQFIPLCETRTPSRRFSIVVNKKIHWLSCIEKALLCVVVCFIEPNFECVGAGRVLIPGQLRNFLTTCSISFKKARCGFMSRFNQDQGMRQSIFIPLLNYDDLTYRKTHRPESLRAVDTDDEKTRSRHVLLYFLTMCHETLNELHIPKEQRFAYLRYMLDNYLDGDQVGLSNEQMPQYLRGENTLVDQLLRLDNGCKILHARILMRVTVINKFLRSGEAMFHNERHAQYPAHVIAVIPTIPVQTSLCDDLSGVLQLYPVQFIEGIHMLSVLMKLCELKLISEMEMHIIRPQRLNQYVFFWVDHQVAVRVQKFIENQRTMIGLSTKDNRFWVADTWNPKTTQLQTLVMLPRQLLVSMTAMTAVQHVHSNPDLALSVGPLLFSAIQPFQDTSKDEFVPNQLDSVILLLARLLIGPTIKQIHNHSKRTSQLMYYLFQHQYQHLKKKTMHRVVDYFARVTRPQDGCSTFGPLGSVLLAWFVAPYTEVWISKNNYSRLVRIANGENLKEIENDVSTAAEKSTVFANSLRRTADFQRFFTNDEKPDSAQFDKLSESNFAILTTIVENFLQPESLYLQFHPDIVFCLMSMLCPSVAVSRVQFDLLFPYTRPSVTIPLESSFYESRHLYVSNPVRDPESFHYQSELSAALACFTIGGFAYKDDRRTEVAALWQKKRLFPNLWFDCESNVLLPRFTHPGEILDPWVMSLLLQVEQSEQDTGRTRYHSDCILFRSLKQSPQSSDYSPRMMPDTSDESEDEKPPKRSRQLFEYPRRPGPPTLRLDSPSFDSLV